jgi:hypothetical protein
MSFKPKTFTSGNPVTADDLNDLQSNIEASYNLGKKAEQFSQTVDGRIKAIVNRIITGTVEVSGLEQNVFKSADIETGSFKTKPVVTVSLAQALQKDQSVALYVITESAVRSKVYARTNVKDLKSVKINFIAVSQEEVDPA